MWGCALLKLSELKLGELLDTPPPGLDEAMAISKVYSFLLFHSLLQKDLVLVKVLICVLSVQDSWRINSLFHIAT